VLAKFALCTVLAIPAFATAAKTCYSPRQASSYQNKDVCIAAHVYNIVDLADGTRFIDVCDPKASDAECRFAIISLNNDRKEVGELKQYLGQDIQIRGVVRPVNGRSEILLSNTRQFRGGAEKFRPNPELMKGFAADQNKPAVNDPAFRTGRHRHTTNPSN